MTKAELDALAELVEKATPGPWMARREPERNDHFIVRTEQGSFGYLDIAELPPWLTHDQPNADLIVALRNAAESLIAAARREAVYRVALEWLVKWGTPGEMSRAREALRRGEEVR